MHIPDNYLSPQTCITMFVAMTPVWAVSISKVKSQIKEKKETVPLLGIASSLSFLIMMFNLPVPGGTTAHAVGGTLLAILLGPWAACLSITVALLLQALLFGDGGILAFGANAFNMAFIMPFFGYIIYLFFKHFKHDRIGAFIGAYFGINLAALIVGIELGIQPLLFHDQSGNPLYSPYPLSISVPAMTSTHLLIIGWVEAIFTVLVFSFVKKASPNSIYLADNHQKSNTKKLLTRFYLLIGGLVVLSPLGLLASGTAWGEWSASDILPTLTKNGLKAHMPTGMAHGLNFKPLLQDYSLFGVSLPIGYIFSAFSAVIIFIILFKLVTHEK
ncbi:cobalt transporter CbiM [Dellaglioa sp. L3N]